MAAMNIGENTVKYANAKHGQNGGAGIFDLGKSDTSKQIAPVSVEDPNKPKESFLGNLFKSTPEKSNGINEKVTSPLTPDAESLETDKSKEPTVIDSITNFFTEKKQPKDADADADAEDGETRTQSQTITKPVNKDESNPEPETEIVTPENKKEKEEGGFFSSFGLTKKKEDETEKESEESEESEEDSDTETAEGFVKKYKEIKKENRRLKKELAEVIAKSKSREMDNSAFTRIIASILAMQVAVKEHKNFLHEYAKKNNIPVDGLNEDDESSDEESEESEEEVSSEDEGAKTDEDVEEDENGESEEDNENAVKPEVVGSNYGEEMFASTPSSISQDTTSQKSSSAVVGENKETIITDGIQLGKPLELGNPVNEPLSSESLPISSSASQEQKQVRSVLGGRNHFVEKRNTKTHKQHKRRNRHQTLKKLFL